MSGPLMSVVVPSFGHAGHIEEALRSVATQEGPSLECIVIDDASRDESAEIVARLFDDPSFADRFEGRLRLEVHASNRGAHAALNRGLELARGEWIALLNSDDAFGSGRLATLLQALTDRGSDLAFSRVVFVDESSRPCPASAESFGLRKHQDVIDRFPTIGFASLRGNAAVSTGNLVFSRKLYESIGPFAPLRYCHDWDFLLRALLKTEPLFVPLPLYRYRLHAANSFRTLEAEADRETEHVLRRYFDALRGGDLENEWAPSPEQWPGYFERFMGRHGFWRYWQEA